MGSGRIIFYFNPLNGQYLYPPFFPNYKAKEETLLFLRGHNSVKATLNFWQIPQIMFLTYPTIRKKMV